MQYKGYIIQTTDSGSIIRNACGKWLVQTPTEEEAKEWIDDQEYA